MHRTSARGRGVAAMVASMALLGSGAAITATPAQSVPPTDDCAAPLPVADITPGLLVDGLTVSRGTEPEVFNGEVLGVLADGIAPGVDMIIAEMTSPEIDRVGIWQGMSGSPVYDANGNLLGAVAYGLSWGPSPVAGITPYEDMDDYLPGVAGAEKVALGDRMARTIAAETDVTARQAANGMSRLRVPLTIAGLTASRLKDLRSERKYISRDGRAGTLVSTAAAAAAADPSSIKDGGNLGAAMSYGTITAGGVGTVTDRCGDDVVGFGHPMMFSGATSLGLMPADALYVQEDSLGAGFKVANFGGPAGTITQDRLTGITGAVGATPQETDITSTVTYGDRAREGLSHSMSADWNADVTAMQMLAMHDVTIDAIQPGSENAGLEITGTADEVPFTISMADRYVSDYDIAFESLWTAADLVWILSRMEGVDVDSVTTDGEVFDSTASWRVSRVEQRRGGEWLKVNRRKPVVARSGGTMVLRSLLTNASGEKWVRQTLDVPRRARGGGFLEVAGGANVWNDGLYDAATVEEVQKALAADVRNDQVQASAYFWGRRTESRKQSVSEAQDLVVVGQRGAEILLRR